jgi:hypothetical protein
MKIINLWHRNFLAKVSFLFAILILLSGYYASEVSNGTNKVLTKYELNKTCFDFSSGIEINENGSCDLNFTGSCYPGANAPPEGCSDPYILHAYSEKIMGIGPWVNLSNVWMIPESSDPMYSSHFPLYQVQDGLAIITSEGNYAAFVVDEVANNSEYIKISYKYQDNGSNILGEKPTEGCFSYENESACVEAMNQGENCFWDFMMNMCMEQMGPGPGPGGPGGNPGCWIFDTHEQECNSVIGCTYCDESNINDSGSVCYVEKEIGLCEGLDEGEGVIECENITDQTLCETIPMLKTCCSWEGGSCVSTTNKSCWEKAEPPEGAYFCDDYKAKFNQTLCNLISSSPYYMPCEWDNESQRCAFRDENVFGGGPGDFGDIGTKASCEAAGGVWITETYTYIDQYGTEKTATDEWCEMKFGHDDCSDACWACEFKPDGSLWGSEEEARQACLNSPLGFCEFYPDPYAPNGFGWCNPVQDVKYGGGNCDQNCRDCDIAPTLEKAKQNCENSSAGCKWFWDPYDNTTGWCDSKDKRSCEEDCFQCFTPETCQQKGPNCEWSSLSYLCKPKGFSGEICFDGIDNDIDGEIDCEDSDCSFDSFCGGDIMSDCGMYKDNVSCEEAEGCAWVRDLLGGERCDHEGAICFMYNGDEQGCNSTEHCKWHSHTGCDINQSMIQTCMSVGSNSSLCNSTPNCVWRTEGPGGEGFCDFHMFQCHEIMNEGQCNNDSRCSWKQDLFRGEGEGHCEPKCFFANSTQCSELASLGCQMVSGFCDPEDMVKMEDCFMYTKQEECNNHSTECFWESRHGCDVNKTLAHKCMEISDNEICNAEPYCEWFQDPMGGEWCDLKFFKCGFEESRRENKTKCENDGFCRWVDDPMSPSGGRCEPPCFSASDEECPTLEGCMLVEGFCNPKMMMQMFHGMQGGPPVDLAWDECPESGIEGVNDICFLGLKDNPNSFGFGIGVVNIEQAAICKDYYGDTQSTKFYWYLDTDGNSENNCNSSDGNEKGFEFFFKYQAQLLNNELNEIRVAYQCVGGNWAPTQIKLSSWTEKMCKMLRGGMVAVDKSDLKKFPSLYNKTAPMRIYATTANESGDENNPIDTVGPGWYTPGTIDFKFEDCSAPGQDLDGDGFTSENDPDCEDFKRFGYVPVEDCFPDGIDNDGNGLIDCEEPHCKHTPQCNGTFSWEPDPNDHTAPKVTRYQVEKFPDGAFIMFDTDEPSNGTLLFYARDATCTNINATIFDLGDPFCNISEEFCKFDDFKLPHFTPIDNFRQNPYKIGYDLSMNTTYFYKTKNCDPSGNCGTSACLNFTTLSECKEFTFKFDSSLSTLVVDFDWYADGVWDILNKDMTYGIRVNCTTGKYANIRMKNPNATVHWSLLLKGARLSDAKKINITNSLLTGEANGTFLGLDSNKWQELFQNLGVEGVELTLPKTADLSCDNLSLLNCDNSGENCNYDVTNSTELIFCNSTVSIWRIPVSLGFTTYKLKGSKVGAEGLPQDPPLYSWSESDKLADDNTTDTNVSELNILKAYAASDGIYLYVRVKLENISSIQYCNGSYPAPTANIFLVGIDSKLGGCSSGGGCIPGTDYEMGFLVNDTSNSTYYRYWNGASLVLGTAVVGKAVDCISNTIDLKILLGEINGSLGETINLTFITSRDGSQEDLAPDSGFYSFQIPESQTYIISLSQGWNLISIPLQTISGEGGPGLLALVKEEKKAVRAVGEAVKETLEKPKGNTGWIIAAILTILLILSLFIPKAKISKKEKRKTATRDKEEELEKYERLKSRINRRR